MADLAQLEAALVKADAAGDVEGARVLAGEVRKMRAAEHAGPRPGATGGELLEATKGGVNRGIAGLLGLPVDTAANIANLGIAGYGLARGAITGDPGASPEPIKAPFGGSESIARGMEKLGIGTTNPRPDDQAARMLNTGAQIVGSSLVPGARPLPTAAAAASGAIAGEALGPEWVAPASMLPGAAAAAYNAIRTPVLKERQAQNQVRDQTLKAAQEEGYKTIPSQINPGPVKNAVESLGGKAAIKQQATIDNQRTTDAIARREIGLPENSPITMQALEARRQQLSAPYNELASLSSNAEYALRELRDARQKATQFWKEYEVQKTVSSLENYKAMDAKAKAMDTRLQAEAVRAGRPELVPAMRDARQAIAKTWDVERALNLGDGTVDAQALGRLYDHGAPLSGGLETIAKFAQGPGRQVTGQASATPSPGVSKLNWASSGLLGAGGMAALGPAAGLAAAAAPFVAPPAARAMTLSDIYQRYAARPDYAPAMLPENDIQSLARLAATVNQVHGRAP